MKRILVLLLIIVIACSSMGCSRYLKKETVSSTTSTTGTQNVGSSSKNKTSTTSASTTTSRKYNTVTQKKSVATQPSETTTTEPETKPQYSVTTRYSGVSNLSRNKMTIPYTTYLGEERSVTVTVITGFENEMLAYVNNERDNANVNRLQLDPELTRLAVIRAAEASVSWSHTRPNGTQCFTVLDTSPLKPRIVNAGENLGWNQTSVRQVMNEWMYSSGHRANIISQYNDYNYVGVAWVIAENGDHFWAQMFAYIE